MQYRFRGTIPNSVFNLFSVNKTFENDPSQKLYTIIWNKGDAVTMLIDGIEVLLDRNTLFSLTPTQQVKIMTDHDQLFIFEFSEYFYCIYEHDNEVSCNGFLFYGSPARHIIVQLDERELSRFELLLDMFREEFDVQDIIQSDMLTILLKRLIIKFTRLARQTYFEPLLRDSQYELIRFFHLYVEFNFRQHREVSFYAQKLHRSSKTLANIFAQCHLPSPLEIIHQRIILEIERQLLFTEKPIKEIACELHYRDIQAFSRFYKLRTGRSPSQFRQQQASLHPEATFV